MVAFVPASKPSKVAPRRHWSTMQGLLVHSRQLHQVLKVVEREDDRRMRMHSPRPAAPVERTVIPQAKKPIVFRKTKREIQRERELAEKKKRQEEEALRMCHESGSSTIMRQLDSFRSTLLASCKRLTGPSTSLPSQRRSSCRTQYLRRTTTSAIGLSRRCPPRRRLLF